jgi:prevent-host-death family protein
MAEPTSNTVGTRELKARLSEYVSEVQFQGQHVKVTRNGKLAAVLVPVDWYVAARVTQRRASSEPAGD